MGEFWVDVGLVNLLSKLAELERKRLTADGLAQCPSDDECFSPLPAPFTFTLSIRPQIPLGPNLQRII
jgi:hypothetical protein